MFDAFATRRNRTLSLVFLVICCASGIAALVVGISDNPPGIALAFGSMTALVLVFVHPWRCAKQYALLLCASILGIVVFGVLHNVFEGVAGEAGSVRVLQVLLQGLGVVAFLLAVLVCPPAVLVSVVGSIVMLIRGWGRPTRRQQVGS